MQQHQREQPPHLGVVGHQPRQQLAEADRLVAQLLADEAIALGGRVALVEDQVHDPQHAAQAVGQLLVGRHPVRDVRVRDLALGAHDPLAHRRLGDQERAGDLARRHAAERPQRERHARRHVQRRVAAGEDQPQPVVDDRALVVHRRLLVLGVQARQLGQPLGAIRHRPVAAQTVDRPPPRGGRDPRARVGRHAVAPPHRDRGLEGVLHRVLGQLEVAGLPDQRGQHDRALVAERARDRGRDRIGRAAHARLLTSSSGQVDAGPARRVQPLLGRHHRAHLDRRPWRHRQPRGLLERLVEVGALQHVVAGQDLLGHRERAVGDLRLPVAHADRRRALGRTQALDADQQPRPRAGWRAAPPASASPARARPARPPRPPLRTPAACTETSHLRRSARRRTLWTTPGSPTAWRPSPRCSSSPTRTRTPPRAYRRAADTIRSAPLPVPELIRNGRSPRAARDRLRDRVTAARAGGDRRDRRARRARARAPPAWWGSGATSGSAPGGRGYRPRARVSTPDEFRAAAAAGRLRTVPGIGPKYEARILEALARESEPRPQRGLLLNQAWELVSGIADHSEARSPATCGGGGIRASGSRSCVRPRSRPCCSSGSPSCRRSWR